MLDHGGFHLWESHAIMQYLADLSVGQSLYPKDAQPRADVNRWLFWCAYHFTPAVGFISRERVSKTMVGGVGPPDPAEIARGEALLASAAQVLDTHLAERQWLTQGGLTLADLAIASPLMHTEKAQLPVAQYQHLQRWFAQVRALDAWKRSEPARQANCAKPSCRADGRSRCSGCFRSQRFARLPQPFRRGVVARGRGRLRYLALDEILARRVGDLRRRGEVDDRVGALFRRTEERPAGRDQGRPSRPRSRRIGWRRSPDGGNWRSRQFRRGAGRARG